MDSAYISDAIRLARDEFRTAELTEARLNEAKDATRFLRRNLVQAVQREPNYWSTGMVGCFSHVQG